MRRGKHEPPFKQTFWPPAHTLISYSHCRPAYPAGHTQCSKSSEYVFCHTMWSIPASFTADKSLAPFRHTPWFSQRREQSETSTCWSLNSHTGPTNPSGQSQPRCLKTTSEKYGVPENYVRVSLTCPPIRAEMATIMVNSISTE